jgi:crotonobetainyl-CoA:carnitine CoA-transferase CaiB-like acyl-CoA transferase
VNGPGPLAGIRVLDLTRVIAGPSCTRSLVELGADVVKLEPPEGDVTRKGRPRVGGVAIMFAQQNCGKRCICVDLASARGRELAFVLATASDVVVENFRPGVMARLGLDFERLQAASPRTILCSMSGYGPDGPDAGRRAYAPVLHAELGHLAFVAERHGTSPRGEAVSHADLYTGMQATVGILAALVDRAATGQGTHVTVSMAETMLAANEWTAVELNGGLGDEITFFGGHRAPMLRLGDGSWVHVPGDPVGTFASWCKVMDRPDLATDPRFATPTERSRHREDLTGELAAWAATVADADDFEERLSTVGMAVGRLRSLAEAAAEPWAEHNGAFHEVEMGERSLRLPRSPVRVGGRTVGLHGRPAGQGEHNAEVMAEVLGLSEAEIDDLTDAGVLRSRPAGDPEPP